MISSKPPHEELEQRVKKLTDELLERDQMEKEVERIFNFSMDMIGSGNLEGYFTKINSSFGKILGYTKKEILEKPFIKFVHDDDVEKTKLALADARKGKKEIYIENRYKCKGGAYKWIEWKVLVIVKENKFIAVGRDVTERKQAEEALKKSEERYRAIADNSRVGFWHIDLEGFPLYINPAMCQMLEVESPEELSGQTYESFFDDRNREIIRRELAKREKGISSSYEVELIGKKGSKRNVIISGSPLYSFGEKLHSTIGTITDITDKKRAEKALVKAHAKLEIRVKERTRELEIKTQNLEETNIAMKVLLKKREEDRKDIEFNILTNVRKLIDPYFDKIRKTKLNSQQNAFLNIMESNLQEITSQFARKISMRELNLTPTEIQVANMIRNGNSSKEIAGIMNISKRTVDAHRRNIRKKLGLVQKRANLRSYLLSLH